MQTVKVKIHDDVIRKIMGYTQILNITNTEMINDLLAGALYLFEQERNGCKILTEDIHGNIKWLYVGMLGQK